MTWRWKSKCLVNKLLNKLRTNSESCRDNRTERYFNKQTLLGPSLSTHRVHTIVICGYSSRSRTSPLATFFKQLRGQSFFLGLLGINCFQLKTIHVTKRHFGVTILAPLHCITFLNLFPYIRNKD